MSSDRSGVCTGKRGLVFSLTQTSTEQPDKRTRVGSDTERMVHESVGMEYAPKAFDDELNEPGTDFDIDIGSIHTNILTRVNEALSQTGGLGEGGDKDKCFVQQMIPAIVTSVATAVGEVMKNFLKKMPKPADVVSVDRSPVVENLQRNLLLMRYENDRLEQYSRRETIKVVGLKEEGEDTEQKVLGVFKAVGADVTAVDVCVVHGTGDRKRKGRPILVGFVSRKKRKEVMQKKKVLKDKREYAGVYVFDDLTTLRAKMLYYLKKKVPVVQNAWTIDGRIHCTKKRRLACRKEKARGGSSPSTPRVISSSLVLMLLTLRSSALQTCFVSRNPMGV